MNERKICDTHVGNGGGEGGKERRKKTSVESLSEPMGYKSRLLWRCSRYLRRPYSFSHDLEVSSPFRVCRSITEYGWEASNMKNSYFSHRRKANKFQAGITRMIISIFASSYVISWARRRWWKTSLSRYRMLEHFSLRRMFFLQPSIRAT